MSANPMTAEHEKAGVLPEDVKMRAATAILSASKILPPNATDQLFAGVIDAILADRASRPSPSAIEGGSSGLTRGTAQRAEGGWRPRVKALEWQSYGTMKCVRASTPFSDYVVWVDGGWYAAFAPSAIAEGVEAAKTAAQADYEARILAALDLPDPDADPKAVDAAARSKPRWVKSGEALVLECSACDNLGVVPGPVGGDVLCPVCRDGALAARSIEPGKDEERLREALPEYLEEAIAVALKCHGDFGHSPQTNHHNARKAARDVWSVIQSALSPSRGEADTSQDRAACKPEGETHG